MKYKKWFLLDFISVFGFALVELGIPTIISDMIDHGIETQDTTYLYSRFVLMAFISVIGVSGVVLLGYCCSKISTNITRDIRNDVFEHAQAFSAAEMEKFGVSSMITRTNNDAYQIMLFLNVILKSALLTPVMMCVSVMLILKISLELSYVVLATIPVVILGVIIVAKVSEPLSENHKSRLTTLIKFCVKILLEFALFVLLINKSMKRNVSLMKMISIEIKVQNYLN